MKEEADDLKNFLAEKFGETIRFHYVDVESDEMKKHPDIVAILNRVRLPLTVLNGNPRFHGGFSANKIIDAINDILK